MRYTWQPSLYQFHILGATYLSSLAASQSLLRKRVADQAQADSAYDFFWIIPESLSEKLAKAFAQCEQILLRLRWYGHCNEAAHQVVWGAIARRRYRKGVYFVQYIRVRLLKNQS